jgi:uncharacterized protein YkwD
MRKIVTSLVVLCLILAGAIAAARIPTSQLAAVVVAMLVDYTNDNRRDYDVPELSVNDQLVVAAQMKANDMVENGYFAHYSPDGTSPWHWIQTAGYDYKHAGENLAVNFVHSRDVTDAWMDSPTHKKNMIDARYSEIGIATARGTYKGKDAVFVVQMFATPTVTATSSTMIAQPEADPSRLGAIATIPSTLFRAVALSIVQWLI